MINFRTGSQAHRLITLLSAVGEFPTHSLYILGNERGYKELVHSLTMPQTLRNPKTEKTFSSAKILNISGKGKSKTIRLYKGAIPILSWIGAEEYYLRAFRSHRFSGDAAHLERNHRVAEAFAMFMGAGFEFREYKLPRLQNREIKTVIPDYPSVYAGRSLKQIGNTEMSKTIFTRLIGAAFAGGNCYAVYNTRSAAMKWCGMGEFKTLHGLVETCRLNAGITNVDSAILFGESDKVALATLKETEINHRLELRFDGIYDHIHFVPLGEIGLRQLALFSIPDWKEQILSLLFEPEQRSYSRGSFEYDACIDGTFVLSHLDGDLARLMRFREAIESRSDKYEVLCFADQVAFLKEYLNGLAQIRVIDRTDVEKELNLERREIFEED